MISNNHYEFEEYTVGAVIKDYPDTEGYITVGVSYSKYEELTGKKAIPENITVYLDKDVTEEQYKEISKNIQVIKNSYGYDFSFVDCYGYFYRTVENQKRVFEFGILLSLLVLMISPIVWFYSQSLFYKKRSKEMYVLTAYGAGGRVLGRIHKTSAVVLSLISFVFTALLGILSSLFVFKLFNDWHNNYWLNILFRLCLSGRCRRRFYTFYKSLRSYRSLRQMRLHTRRPPRTSVEWHRQASFEERTALRKSSFRF